MKQPLQILFLGLETSDTVEAAARERAGKLGRFCADIVSCRVTIELANKHRVQGRQFSVRVDIRIPEHELSVSRVHDEDVYVALREAFDDMKRQLNDSMQRARAAKPVKQRSPGAAFPRAAGSTAPAWVDRPDDASAGGDDPGEESGPHETYESAQAARVAGSEEAVVPDTAARDAGRQLDGADRNGVETEAPAQGRQGESPPHFQED